MSRTLQRPYSQIVGIAGALEAYCLDVAIVRWGSAFQAAIESAAQGAKTQEQAQQAAERVLRRWVPSTRKYR